MKDLMLWIVNNVVSRIFIAFIMCGTVASPYINGFSDSRSWLYAALALFIAVIITRRKAVEGKYVWIVYTWFILFLILLVCLFFAWG